MFLIINKADLIVCFTPAVRYVMVQSNGCTVSTEEAQATAVYAEANDTFYRLVAAAPGDELYHVAQVSTIPEGAEPGGWKYVNGEVVADEELIAVLVRDKRTKLLRDTDWTQSLDAPISAESREEIRLYRQALRDITEQVGFPLSMTWPESPTVIKDAPDPVDTAFDTMVGGEGNA